MKLSNLAKCLFLAPIALCTAQTPPKPSAPTAKPPVVTAPSTTTAAPSGTKSSLSLEDVPGADPVVITIGDERITKSEFERLIAALPEQARAQAQGPGKKKIAEQVAELKSLAQEARKRGVDRKPETRELISFQTDNLLANALYRDIANGAKPDEAADRAYYDQHKTEYEQVKASHILIRFKGSAVPLKPNQKDLTEEEALAKAQELRKKLIAGEDFAKLATAESDDATAAKQGGSLGSFSKGHMVPAFEQAAFSLPVGQVSEPVKTQFGYHLIKVDEHATQKFEEVQSSIEQKLKPEMARKAVEEIRKQTPVTLNDAYFSK
jgi:peptidyl-prolyl cis-trans isomerase C